GTDRDRARLAGTGFAAGVIKKARGRGALLDALLTADAALAAELDSQQFVFDDLSQLSQKDLQLVLREVDPAQLAVALKGAAPAVRELVFAAMSKRAASQLQDDLADRGPMKRSEVETAQREICRQVRRLGDAAAITLPTQAEPML
ncbi:FliG C-terminal domain-containing protein, partial [Sandarakinorhabdus rubra]|uniref:FliG C-terminal domain-containing protein n=1 Tax=Sandarakinorhabdus rubra TaxID=2672568 RepID=UPI002E2869BA